MKSLFLCLVLASTALAAPEANTEKARAAFQAAQALYQAGRFADALTKFQEAQALKPHPVIIFNIARCHEQLGAVPQALAAYREYLRLSPDASDREAVNASIASLEKPPQNQQFVVSVEPAAAVVKVDGQRVGSSPASIELPAGEHSLEVSAEGYEPLKRSFTMSAQRPLEMNVSLSAKAVAVVPVAADAPTRPPELTPLEAPPMPPLVSQADEPRRTRTFTWIAGGTALASGAVATGLGIAANVTADDLRSGLVRPSADLDRIATHAQDLATGANVAWVVAGTAAVTAIVLFFVEK
jgi:tetratricopeptide (TPR) repeat protein